MVKLKLAAADTIASPARNGKWLVGDPAWEATKAVRRNLSPSEGVRECDEISKRFAPRGPGGSVMVELQEILRALRAKKVPFVLIGAHGIGGWTGRPRATKDVDILVKSGRNYGRAVNALKALYPHLETRRFVGVTGFFAPGETESLIDVTFPHRADNMETLRTALWVEDEKGKYRVPTLEAALANKYGAMLTPTRDFRKRAQDAVDFAFMVTHSQDEGREPIDLERLAALGELVWSGGGGPEILRLVDQVNAGQLPSVVPDKPPHQ